MPEREVADPRTVGRDAVGDRTGKDERADGGRREDRLGHRRGRRRSRRIAELVGVRAGGIVSAVADVGRADDDLDRRRRELRRGLLDISEPLGDRVRQAVVVRAEQRQPPQRMRPEDVVRLQLEHEPLERLEPVERRHRPGERARGRAVDPADPRPERAGPQPLKEAELEQDAVDRTAGEDDCDVALHLLRLIR